MKKKFFANLWLTFHSWSPFLIMFVRKFPFARFRIYIIVFSLVFGY